jgi:hypothetical protein
MGNKEIQDPQLAYITESYTQDTGGGFVCDVLVLDDARVLVISEEAIVLYKNMDAWENRVSEQEGVIYRATSS